MATNLEIVSAETAPVTVAEAKAYCRLFDSAQDSVMAILVDAAIEFVEGQLRESLRVRNYRLTANAGEITAGFVLPKWPVLSIVSLSVDGNNQSLTGLGVDQFQWPAKLTGNWPSGASQVLTWRAGYTTLSAARKCLILQVVADMYANREASGGSMQMSIGTKLLLEGENQHIDAVRG
jgi:uncharacterized phiE125 gp8 family phage protein